MFQAEARGMDIIRGRRVDTPADDDAEADTDEVDMQATPDVQRSTPHHPLPHGRFPPAPARPDPPATGHRHDPRTRSRPDSGRGARPLNQAQAAGSSTGRTTVDDRAETMRYHGVHYCPDWCVQVPEEHQYEDHWGQWAHVATDDGEQVAVRARESWWDDDHDRVELAVTDADGNQATVWLSTAQRRQLVDLIDRAEVDIDANRFYDRYQPAYDGAEDDAATMQDADGDAKPRAEEVDDRGPDSPDVTAARAFPPLQVAPVPGPASSPHVPVVVARPTATHGR